MAIYRCPVLISYTGPGAPGVSVWHFRTIGSAGADTSQVQGLVDIIRAFYNSCISMYPSTTTLTLGTVSEEGTQVAASPTWTLLTGTGASSYAPQGLAIVTTWRTAIAARRGRGRVFQGPVHNGVMQTDGSITDSYRTIVQNASSALVASSAGFGNGAIGVYGLSQSAKDSGLPNDEAPHVLRDVTGSAVRDVFGFLRSRRD